MGIRYYAYAFDASMTDLAMASPRRFISDDPLADAWGMTHGAQVAETNFEQSVPETEMLYLDKAWSSLQALSAPRMASGVPRPAYRMFEGQVTMTKYGWIPWVRALSPDEVREIAEDLVGLERSVGETPYFDQDARYVHDYLRRAVEFVTHATSCNCGFAYMIG